MTEVAIHEGGAAAPEPDPPTTPTAARPRRRLRFWHELAYIAVFYFVYSLIRDIHGSKPVSKALAFRHAKQIIGLERWLHVFFEHRIQVWFLSWHGFIEFWDDFYGSAHFIMAIVALIFLFRWQPQRYPFWRNTLAACTALALIGFAFYPLLPPRLLPEHYHFVDTLKSIGGLWNFDSGPVNAVSNQYAAMPSMHTAWSMWAALVFLPVLKHWWSKALMLLYPAATVFCIVVTGNHYVLDAVGGYLALGAGLGIGWVITQWRDGRWRQGGTQTGAAVTDR